MKKHININNINKHSKRVAKVYKASIYLIILGVFTLLIQLYLGSEKGDGIQNVPANSSEMIAPKYQGLTGDGKSFSIISKTAKEIKDGVILLNSPIASLFENNKLSDLVLDSDSGIYDNNNKTLTLKTHVALDDGKGNTLKAEEIKLDLEKNIIYSDNKIDLTGKIGKITAEGLEIRNNGKVIIFKGNSKLIINNEDKVKQ